jgi:hypothetical protein
MKLGDLVCLSDYVTELFPGVTLWETEHLWGRDVTYWGTPGVGILLRLGSPYAHEGGFQACLILTSTGHVGWTETKNIEGVS